LRTGSLSREQYLRRAYPVFSPLEDVQLDEDDEPEEPGHAKEEEEEEVTVKRSASDKGTAAQAGEGSEVGRHVMHHELCTEFLDQINNHFLDACVVVRTF
jgi:hypothetical protein